MDNRNTLRSQTVQCTHCGEYYSVTYDYCPFCDAGRKEAEKKKGSLLGGLLGSPEPEKKKPRSQGSDKNAGRGRPTPRRRDESQERAGRETGRIPPVGRETGRLPPVSRPTGRIPPVSRETGRIPPVGRETGRIPPVSRDTGRIPQERKEAAVAEEPPRRRKKISEMTEEERAANRAQREARAAQRKRERERAAAEAAAKAAQKEAAVKAAQAAERGEAPGPVFETMTPPPSFGFEPDSGAHTQPVGHPEEEKSSSGIIRTITIPLKGAGLAAAVAAAAELAETEGVAGEPEQPAAENQEKAPESAAPGEEELAQSQWAFMRDLEQSSSGTVVEVAGDLNGLGQEGSPPAAEQPQEEAPPAAPAPQPEAPAAPEAKGAQPEAEKAAQPASQEREQPPAEHQEKAPEPIPLAPEDLPLSASRRMNRVPPPPPPEVDPTVEPVSGDPDIIIPKIETEEDLDNLLAEIREILAEDSPGAAHAKAEEEATTVFAPHMEVDEPTKPIPVLPKKGEAKPWAAPAPEQSPAPPAPEKDAGLEAEEEDDDLLDALDEEEDEDDEALFLDQQPGKKEKKKKSGFQVAMLALSLVIIVVAGFIVARNFIPALQTGIFAGLGKGEEEEQKDTAQTFILNQKDMVFSEPGMTTDLVPTFAPEGTTARLTWSSSNNAVASVDEYGKVTTISPGEATIVAAMASGQSAQCQIRCNWTVDEGGNVTPTEPGAGGQPEGEGQPTATGEMSLSDETLSLDSPGAARQLTLNGAAGEVQWSSSKHSVATVDQNGTVTAVAVGGATITATCDGKTFTCEVRCIW